MRNEELRYRLAAMIFLFCRGDLGSPETVEKYKNNKRTLFAPTYKQRIYANCRGRRPRCPAFVELFQ